MVSLVKAKEVLLPLCMVHVTMKLVDMPTRQDLLLCGFSRSLISLGSEVTSGKELPVEMSDQLVHKVDELTVAHKDNDLRLLLSEQKLKQIE